MSVCFLLVGNVRIKCKRLQSTFEEAICNSNFQDQSSSNYVYEQEDLSVNHL